MKPLVIVAAGGLGREAAAVVDRLDRWDLVGFLDDDPERVNTEVAGKPVIGTIVAAREHPSASFLVCAGKGQARRDIVTRLRQLGISDDRFATLISPDVHVPASCSVGPGSILLSGTVLTTDVTIGAHVVTMPGVVLTHDNYILDFATLCARVTLGGNVTVGESAYLGMGALVRERVDIAADSVLGMGAVLLRDLPQGEVWVGVPAQRLHQRSTPDGRLVTTPPRQPGSGGESPW